MKDTSTSSKLVKYISVAGLIAGGIACIGFAGFAGFVVGPILIIVSIAYLSYDANKHGSGYVRVAMD